MISLGGTVDGDEIVIRNHDNDTALVLTGDLDEFRTVVDMLVDELNSRDGDTEYQLEEYALDYDGEALSEGE
jgi:hypothetical protein